MSKFIITNYQFKNIDRLRNKLFKKGFCLNYLLKLF